MKAELNGFKYFLNGVQLKDYDEWDKKIKNINVETTVDSTKLELHARTV